MAATDRDTFERDEAPAPKPWLGVKFTCSGAYLRVFRNSEGTGYAARCPKCGKCIRFRVGAGGTEQRFFEVSC